MPAVSITSMRVCIRGQVVQPGLCCARRTRGPPGEEWWWSEVVGLLDGSVPVVGDRLAEITGLEPAIWFKVLVLDTICIDFISRSIQWTTCRHNDCPERKMGDMMYRRCKHTHECLLNEEFYLPDVDLQRGLDLAKNILIRQEENDQMDLLHLLHVYILPIIRLHSEDKDHVMQALTNQKHVLIELDARIDQMSNERTKIKVDMRKWREAICEGLQKESAIVSCNAAFLKLLCRHLGTDIKNSYVELDACQKKVEESKLQVKKKEGTNYISNLQIARASRDEVADRITKSLFVVEEVGLMLRVSKSPESCQLTDMHTAYIKIQDDWESHTLELTELQRKKICATSVREALVNTEAELKEGGFTTGVEITSDGITRPTDVLGPDSLPSGWETLQSQVSKSLQLNTMIKEPHNDFNRWVRRHCAAELNVRGHSDHSWREKIPTLQCTQVEESANVTCLRVSPDQFSNLRQSIKEKQPSAHYQGLTKSLQHEIFLHFEKVVVQLVKDPAVPCTCFARLWTCYERCFFSSRSEDIVRMYERAYAAETKNLKNILPSVTVKDLELDDEWILNILGLYAPDFDSPLAETNTMVEAQGKGASLERTPDEGGPRERVESGIGVDGALQPRMRPKVRGRVDSLRLSHRYTKIIDMVWVSPGASESPWPERASTWSGIEREERNSRGDTCRRQSEDSPDEQFSSSVPAMEVNKPDVFKTPSLPINIPNKNSNARTLAIPETVSACDSGVCLNITGETAGVCEPPTPDNPLGSSCQDNPNIRLFRERFQTAYHCFRVVLQDSVPMAKLQWLYRCIQEVNTTAEKQSQLIFCGKPRMLSGDDLLTSLILFLLHGEVDEMAKGYHHLMLLQDYLPNFLDKGHFGFTVIQFQLAYNYILAHMEKQTTP